MTVPATLGALLGLDAELVDRIRRGERLAEIARAAVLAIAVGGAAYGAAFGIWRAPTQALFGALKLPAVLLGVAMLTAGSSAVLAPLLGARLRPAQSVVSILVSLAVTAMLLGALAPAAILVALTLAPPESAGASSIAQWIVLAHTLTIAVAGIAGVLSLLRLVERLTARRAIARRVVVAWMATQLLAGAQLSWLARPFLGAPDRAVTFFAPHALDGGFFDEVWRLTGARFGAASPVVLCVLAIGLGAWIVVALGETARARATLHPGGLQLASEGEPTELVPFARIATVEVSGPRVHLSLVPDATLVARTVEVPCGSGAEASALAAGIERARRAPDEGPYRASAVPG